MKQTLIAFRFAATGTQLLLMLSCALIARYAPVAGRYLGRWAGRAIVAGCNARAVYNARYAATVAAIVAALVYHARQFIAAQFGAACPVLQAAIAPYRFNLYATVPTVATPAPDAAGLTIRQLEAIACAAGIYGYGSMQEADLLIAPNPIDLGHISTPSKIMGLRLSAL